MESKEIPKLKGQYYWNQMVLSFFEPVKKAMPTASKKIPNAIPK